MFWNRKKESGKKPQDKIDPQKLIEALEGLQKLAEKENRARQERVRQMEEARERLVSATDELLKCMDKTEIERQRQATWRNSGCPLTQPLPVGKPLKLKKPARALPA
jgi:hypothetical protein